MKTLSVIFSRILCGPLNNRHNLYDQWILKNDNSNVKANYNIIKKEQILILFFTKFYKGCLHWNVYRWRFPCELLHQWFDDEMYQYICLWCLRLGKIKHNAKWQNKKYENIPLFCSYYRKIGWCLWQGRLRIKQSIWIHIIVAIFSKF